MGFWRVRIFLGEIRVGSREEAKKRRSEGAKGR
ncbi:MAG: hypothetical protein ACI9X4_002783, partial [Glaciecola sp.]